MWSLPSIVCSLLSWCHMCEIKVCSSRLASAPPCWVPRFWVLRSGSTATARAICPADIFWKNSKKGVDNCGSVWYSNKAVGAAVPRWAQLKSFVKKLWKKCLTKSGGCVKLKKLLRYEMDRRSKNFWKKFLTSEMKFGIMTMFRRKRRVPCKLNNVTKRKHQHG